MTNKNNLSTFNLFFIFHHFFLCIFFFLYFPLYFLGTKHIIKLFLFNKKFIISHKKVKRKKKLKSKKNFFQQKAKINKHPLRFLWCWKWTFARDNELYWNSCRCYVTEQEGDRMGSNVSSCGPLYLIHLMLRIALDHVIKQNFDTYIYATLAYYLNVLDLVL